MIGSNAVDSKNKNLEEAKRTADIVMQQLNKQLIEISMKYSEEKTLRENCQGDLVVCQKSLRKALDEIRDFGKKEEAWSQVIIKKDIEIDKLKNIVENVSVNINKGLQSSARRLAPTTTSGLLSAPKRNIRSKTAASSIAPSTISGSTLESPPKRSNATRAPHERLSTTLTASAVSHFEAAERERIEKEEKRDEKVRESSGIGIEKQSKFINTYVNPKGHRSWLDAIGPTASRVANVTANETEYNHKKYDITSTTSTMNGLSRPPINRSPTRSSKESPSILSRSSKESPSILSRSSKESPSILSSPLDKETESSAQRKAVATARVNSRSNSFDHMSSTIDTPFKTTIGSTTTSAAAIAAVAVDDGQNKNYETHSLTYTTATEQTGNTPISPNINRNSSLVIESPPVNQSHIVNSPIITSPIATNRSQSLDTPFLKRFQTAESIPIDISANDDATAINDSTSNHQFQTVDSPMTVQSEAQEIIINNNNTSSRKKDSITQAMNGMTSTKKRFSTATGTLVLNPQSRNPSSTIKNNSAAVVSKGFSKDLSRKEPHYNSTSTYDMSANAYKDAYIDESSQLQHSRRDDPLSTIRRVPIISARSEEAMRKHQVVEQKC